jgi:hypothetical protein
VPGNATTARLSLWITPARVENAYICFYFRRFDSAVIAWPDANPSQVAIPFNPNSDDYVQLQLGTYTVGLFPAEDVFLHLSPHSDDGVKFRIDDVSLLAELGPTQYMSLSVLIDPPGAGMAAISPSSEDGKYIRGAQITLTGREKPGFSFKAWENVSGVPNEEERRGSENGIHIRLTDNRILQAIFEPAVYNLTIDHGRTGTVDPAGIRVLRYGATLALTATPNEDSAVYYWRVDGKIVQTGGEEYIWNQIVGDHHLEVSFGPTPFHVQIDQTTNGTVLLNPPGGLYAPGTRVVLLAKPDPGFTFVSWGGDISGANNSVTLALTADKTISANFIQNPMNGRLRIARGGDRPIVTVTPQPPWIETLQISSDLIQWNDYKILAPSNPDPINVEIESRETSPAFLRLRFSLAEQP